MAYLITFNYKKHCNWTYCLSHFILFKERDFWSRSFRE